jgi:hypothetical protein
MTEQRWEELVHRLEALAARKPRAYRFRVGLLAAAGFGAGRATRRADLRQDSQALSGVSGRSTA